MNSTLGNIMPIGQNITKASTKAIKACHKLIFENEGDRNNRKRLREFKGFEFEDVDKEKLQKKIDFATSNITLGELNSICQVLTIENDANDKEELVEMLCTKLNDVKLLISESETNHDDDNDEMVPLTLNDDKRDDDDDIAKNSNDESDNDDNDDVANSIASTNRSKISSKKSIPKFVLTFKDVEDTVTTFDGSDTCSVDKWFVEFEETASLMGWTEVEMLIYGKRLLKGEALLFVRSEKGIHSWTTFKKKLQEEFGKAINSAALHKMLCSRKKRRDETLSQYLLRMREIAAQGSIEEDALIDYVIDGIVDDEINKAILYGTHSLKQFKEKLKLYEKMKNKQATEKSSHQKETNVKNSDSRKQNMKKEERCFNCGKRGHVSQNCHDKGRGMKCFACNGFGHIAKDCRKPTSERREETKGSYLVNEVKEQLPGYKQVKLNDHQIQAFFDTGSDLNLLKASGYIRIGTPKFEENAITLKGIGSNSVKTLGRFNARMVVDGCYFTTAVHIVPDDAIPMELIVGKPILEEVTLTINTDEIEVSSRKTVSEAEKCLEENENEILLIDADNCLDVGDQAYYERVASMIENYGAKEVTEPLMDIQAKIILQDEIPVYQHPRRLSIPEKHEVEKQLDEWLRNGIIRPSTSDYASPIVLVKKKDGSTRICVDFRRLNRKVIKDRYPLPIIEDVIDQLAGARIFTTLDLKNGFFHVPVAEDSIKYTAFVTPSGQFEFLRMPFGFCNSPAVFERNVTNVFKYLIRKGIVVKFIDDMIIPAKNADEAIERLEQVLETAENFGLEFNWKKCQFLKTNVVFLGHEIENGVVKPNKEKVAAVINFPKPTTVKKLQSFLGLTGYFRKYIQDYALIAKPLSDILKGKKNFSFGTEEEIAFKKLKEILSTEPLLRIFDHANETELHVDASQDGFGAVLLQKCQEDGELYPVYYWSRKTSDAQKKYHSYELEVLAVIEALKKFRVYLLGIHFKILTDCAAFAATMNKKDLCTRVARWALLLEEYDYTIQHRAGNRMKHCDALSRNPITMVIQTTFIEQLREAQLQDDHLKTIIKILETQPHENYELKNGLLYKNKDGNDLIVIPSMMQHQIIKNAHENGHFALNKTKDLIEREFYITSLEEKIRRFIKNCVPCILTERKMGKQEGYLNPIEKGDAPLQTYHIDHLGPMMKTGKGYQHLLVVIDSFTKFVWLHPTKSTSTKEVINKLDKQKEIFGNPATIISDRGTAFTSQDFKDYCMKENIKHVKITTGVPRGNGQVERINRIIIPALTKLCIEQPENWYRHIRKLQEVLNSTYQRSIGRTPFKLLFGVEMKRKDDIKVKQIIEEELIESFVKEREDMRIEAKQQMKKVQDENIKTYNKKRKPATNYEEGEWVAIRRTQFQNLSKLLPKFLGPYRVTKKMGPDRYEVDRIGEHAGPRKTTSSADNMKPWVNPETDEGVFETNTCQDGRDVGTDSPILGNRRLRSGKLY